LLLGAIYLPIFWTFLGVGRGRMASAMSPDGRYRVTLDEHACGIDRNFDLLLWDRNANEERTIDYGYDQSPTTKREHFVWSLDSTMVALVGDEYAASEQAKLPSGDYVCLVYDAAHDRLYANSFTRDTFTAERAVEVFGDAILQPAPPIE